jgi:hypothetical protein
VPIIPLFTKRLANFTNLTANTSETQVAVKQVQVDGYRQGMIVIRAHTRDLASAGSSIAIMAQVTAPTAEDPSQNFDSASIGIATISNGSTATMANVALSNMGGYLKISVIGTRSASGGNASAEISADLILTP